MSAFVMFCVVDDKKRQNSCVDMIGGNLPPPYEVRLWIILSFELEKSHRSLSQAPRKSIALITSSAVETLSNCTPSEGSPVIKPLPTT